MKKAGEKAKSVLVHGIFIVIVMTSLYFIATHAPSITGHAVLDANTSKAKLESALASSAMFSQVTQASICVIINDPELPLSLQAVKASTGWTVYEMKDFCTGQTNEDFIVQFPDYDTFSEAVDNPSPRNLANGAINQDFEILPSKYVELGGNVECDATFKAKYCTALKTMASTDQLIDGDLSCCIDEWTKADRKLLEQHLQEGNYNDEQKVLEQPTTIAGLSMGFIMGAGGAALLIIIAIIVFVAKGHEKPKPAAKPMPRPGMPGAKPVQAPAGALPAAQGAGMAMPGMPMMQQPVAQPVERPEITELRDYVTQAMGEGYPYDEIRAHLLEIGWDTSVADKVLQEAYNTLTRGGQN